jgi:hypothetical protein
LRFPGAYQGVRIQKLFGIILVFAALIPAYANQVKPGGFGVAEPVADAVTGMSLAGLGLLHAVRQKRPVE